MITMDKFEEITKRHIIYATERYIEGKPNLKSATPSSRLQP
jgi:hypothetical protein